MNWKLSCCCTQNNSTQEPAFTQSDSKLGMIGPGGWVYGLNQSKHGELETSSRTCLTRSINHIQGGDVCPGNRKKMKLLRIILAVLLLSCGSVTAQRSFGFVSPNTRDNLKLEDAIDGMDSQEELSLLSRARNMGCVIKRRVITETAVGSWSDG